MTGPSITPDFTALEVPMDTWSEPFWQGTAEHRLTFPRCTTCGTFRWPAGPFCPSCHAQPVDWVPAGEPRIYSFTILPVRSAGDDEPARQRIPVLVEFADAPGVRLVSVLIDAMPEAAAIDARLVPHWLPAANAVVPAFRLASPEISR
ncbi:Zn-ribbon domain-containing OB-fold protein [Novosphingobium sp. JCM 18896]|uniref:Zn-ribbon domain-containing OB-fold protein n=1 Tax=Novosphingobium sp. JCM 18896 TaxID=2989731 RepID=UPI0022227656|nr:zinc ribbon domain-containing protein [Novosphingobium sp. JCM 18896]MCW1431247.1 zinc ribbon domain-containing protein [Novosphingobium sp. JCM 18896]